jgi:hypothetical protein
MPVDTTTGEQLQAYFRQRREARRHLMEPADENLEKAFRKFGAARFKALYRHWLRNGDSAIWAAQSPVLRDVIASGIGRLECVELSRQYLQLTLWLAWPDRAPRRSMEGTTYGPLRLSPSMSQWSITEAGPSSTP